MDSILNSDELDALRAAVEQDVLPPEDETGPARSDTVILDGAELPRFRFGEGRVGAVQREERLSVVFDKAARALATRLSDILEAATDVSVTWLEETKFASFRETFEVDSRELANMEFRVPGVAGTGLVCLEPELVDKMVEGLMGGAAMADAPRGRRMQRGMTELDLRVSRRWVTGFLQDLGVAWNAASPMDLSLVGMDVNGGSARAFGDSIPVVAGLFEIVVGRRTVGMLGVVMPNGAVDSMASTGAREINGDNVNPGPAPLLPMVPDFEVEIEIALGHKRVSVREILSLSVGDVIFLDGRQNTTGYVQGVPKFKCVPGASAGHKAVQISHLIGRMDEHV
jgi:flagellar motor switch protein FliM